jgi:hypothetical protein
MITQDYPPGLADARPHVSREFPGLNPLMAILKPQKECAIISVNAIFIIDNVGMEKMHD